eukprot:TRINITY_DN4457_c0_g1_i1.p1 TRINITY_DN4457_c0_g1~~TRINITY_DN4457_c0_g1_i1.p1  ORF type:complete len:286 (-),score=88.96 TRINITY_DN4457_c0_g1_i1:7-864(-)
MQTDLANKLNLRITMMQQLNNQHKGWTPKMKKEKQEEINEQQKRYEIIIEAISKLKQSAYKKQEETIEEFLLQKDEEQNKILNQLNEIERKLQKYLLLQNQGTEQIETYKVELTEIEYSIDSKTETFKINTNFINNNEELYKENTNKIQKLKDQLEILAPKKKKAEEQLNGLKEKTYKTLDNQEEKKNILINNYKQQYSDLHRQKKLLEMKISNCQKFKNNIELIAQNSSSLLQQIDETFKQLLNNEQVLKDQAKQISQSKEKKPSTTNKKKPKPKVKVNINDEL